MKNKFTVVFFICIMLITIVVPKANAESGVLLGDINKDGLIDSKDLLIMVRHIAGENNSEHSEWILEGEKYEIADITNNGLVNGSDLLVVLRYLAAKNNPDEIGKRHPEWLETTEKEEIINTNNLNDEEISQDINPRMIKIGISNGEINNNTVEINKMEEYEEGGIQLNKTELEMKINEVCKLEAVLDPEIDGKDEIEWETNNKDVVEIYSGGMIVGKNEGEAIITVKVGNRKAKCRVNVVARGEEVNRIVLDKKELEIEVGEKGKIGVTVEPASAKNKDIRYRIGNNEIAEVDENGIITGKRTGTTSLMVMAGKRSEICVIKVKESKVEAEEVLIDKKEVEIKEGETAKLLVGIKPKEAINREIEIESDNVNISIDKKVVEVDDVGQAEINIIGRKAGEGIIKAKIGEKETVCKVKVKEVEVNSIKLDSNEITMQENQLRRIRAKLEPEEIQGKEIIWETSNREIAEVDSEGLVSGKKEGEAIITATSGGKSASCKVKVEKTKLAVLGVALSTNNIEVQEDKTVKITVNIAPKEASNKEVNLKLDNDNASIKGERVTVNEEGKAEIEITGKKTGKTVLTVSSGAIKTKCNIVIKPKVIAVNKITLSKSNLTIDKYKTAKLTIKIEPTNSTNKEISLKTNNSNISLSKTKITVGNNGTAEVTITGKKAGEATITATSGGRFASCKVKINVVAESITLSEKNVAIDIGKTKKLKTTISPANAVDKSIKWTSSNTNVATVDKNGTITGKKEGKATITAKTSSGKTATATVNVAATKIDIDRKILMLDNYKYNIADLTAELSSDVYKDSDITWKISNSNVAKFNKDGKQYSNVTGKKVQVKGLKFGDTTITVSIPNGKKVACKLKVICPSTEKLSGDVEYDRVADGKAVPSSSRQKWGVMFYIRPNRESWGDDYVSAYVTNIAKLAKKNNEREQTVYCGYQKSLKVKSVNGKIIYEGEIYKQSPDVIPAIHPDFETFTMKKPKGEISPTKYCLLFTQKNQWLYLLEKKDNGEWKVIKSLYSSSGYERNYDGGMKFLTYKYRSYCKEELSYTREYNVKYTGKTEKNKIACSTWQNLIHVSNNPRRGVPYTSGCTLLPADVYNDKDGWYYTMFVQDGMIGSRYFQF